MRANSGFSLPEILVTTGIMSLLSLLLLQFFVATNKVTEQGAAHTLVQQSCRHLVNRLTPLIMGATAPNDEQNGIPKPDSEDSAPSGELWLYSPDDQFGGPPFDPRNPTFHFYRVRRAGARVMLEALQDDGTPLTSIPPRQLALEVDSLEFERVEAGLVRVHVTAQTKVRNVPIHADLRTTISIPYYTTPQ